MSERSFGLMTFAALVAASNLWAQLTVSTLRGTVTDPAGAVVVNAHITVVNSETNLTRELNTTENGDFEIVDLQRGTGA